MKYFTIQNSLDAKKIGQIPQVKEVIHNCNIWDEPNFIEKFPFKKINKKPILSNVVLYTKAKKTDLIEVNSVGFSFGSMLVSDKLKELLSRFKCFGVQFFPTHIFHKNKKNDNYWQTHINDIPYDFIDFKNTEFLLKDRDEFNKPIQMYLKIINKKDFLESMTSMKYPKMLFLKKISFVEEMNLDYFFIKNFEGANLGIVSEKLKTEIEKQEFTGVEFKPIEVSLNEWLGSNGLREKIYGRVPQARPGGSTRK